MFIGRKSELSLLEKLYASPSFEFLILYGRHRVGKTALLSEFAGEKKLFSFPHRKEMMNSIRRIFPGRYRRILTVRRMAHLTNGEARGSTSGGMRERRSCF